MLKATWMKLKPPIKTSFEVVFSKTGELFCTINRRSLSVWKVTTGERIANFNVLRDPSNMDFSPDDTRVVVKNTSGEIAIYNRLTGDRLIHRTPLERNEGCQIYFSPDGTQVIDGSWAGEVTIRSTDSLEPMQTLTFENCQIKHMQRLSDRIAFSVSHKYGHPNFGLGEDFIALYSWSLDEMTRMTGAWSNLGRFGLSSDGKVAAVLDRFTHLELIDTTTVRVLNSVNLNGIGGNLSLDWSPDGSLLSAVEEQQVTLFHTPSLERLYKIPVDYPCAVCFSPDGTLLAIGSWQKGALFKLGHLG